MSHQWHIHADHERPCRSCYQCNHHQDGTWYLDHIADIWLIAWDEDKSSCRVVPDFTQGIPGESERQANWRFN